MYANQQNLRFHKLFLFIESMIRQSKKTENGHQLLEFGSNGYVWLLKPPSSPQRKRSFIIILCESLEFIIFTMYFDCMPHKKESAQTITMDFGANWEIQRYTFTFTFIFLFFPCVFQTTTTTTIHTII